MTTPTRTMRSRNSKVNWRRRGTREDDDDEDEERDTWHDAEEGVTYYGPLKAKDEGSHT